jgi:hypothetical protein
VGLQAAAEGADRGGQPAQPPVLDRRGSTLQLAGIPSTGHLGARLGDHEHRGGTTGPLDLDDQRPDLVGEPPRLGDELALHLDAELEADSPLFPVGDLGAGGDQLNRPLHRHRRAFGSPSPAEARVQVEDLDAGLDVAAEGLDRGGHRRRWAELLPEISRVLVGAAVVAGEQQPRPVAALGRAGAPVGRRPAHVAAAGVLAVDLATACEDHHRPAGFVGELADRVQRVAGGHPHGHTQGTIDPGLQVRHAVHRHRPAPWPVEQARFLDHSESDASTPASLPDSAAARPTASWGRF